LPSDVGVIGDMRPVGWIICQTALILGIKGHNSPVCAGFTGIVPIVSIYQVRTGLSGSGNRAANHCLRAPAGVDAIAAEYAADIFLWGIFSDSRSGQRGPCAASCSPPAPADIPSEMALAARLPFWTALGRTDADSPDTPLLAKQLPTGEFRRQAVDPPK